MDTITQTEYAEYTGAVTMIDRMHRAFVGSIAGEIRDASKGKLNFAQGMILHSIGSRTYNGREIQRRGMYSGSSIAHNMAKLEREGLIERYTPIGGDRRMVYFRCTQAGIAITEAIAADLANQAAKARKAGLSVKELSDFAAIAAKLEFFLEKQS
jgi:DNA-binding MarR family transcriptional regulator